MGVTSVFVLSAVLFVGPGHWVVCPLIRHWLFRRPVRQAHGVLLFMHALVVSYRLRPTTPPSKHGSGGDVVGTLIVVLLRMFVAALAGRNAKGRHIRSHSFTAQRVTGPRRQSSESGEDGWRQRRNAGPGGISAKPLAGNRRSALADRPKMPAP